MNKWIKRILIGLAGFLVILVLALAGLLLFDTFFGPKTADVANTSYINGVGAASGGYLAEPAGPGPHPAVLMLHEWWGLDEGITAMADALAAEGYVVFAPDVYRGRVTAQVPRALYWRLTTPEEQVTADVDAALAHMMSLPTVDSERVASLGFCFGGEHSLLLGLRQSETVPLTIMLYGAVTDNPAELAGLAASQGVLGIFGEEDAQIPVSEVQAFDAGMDALGIPNEVTIYPGVGHAFVNEENYDEPGPAGEAWQQILNFLAVNF